MSTPWWFFLIAAGLIVMSGFFSGLNLGLMSLAPDVGCATVSTSVFHCWQFGHCPAHFGAVPPHSVHV